MNRRLKRSEVATAKVESILLSLVACLLAVFSIAILGELNERVIFLAAIAEGGAAACSLSAIRIAQSRWPVTAIISLAIVLVVFALEFYIGFVTLYQER